MGQVAIAINGRRYEVNCDDDEEDRVRQLAERVDQRIRSLAESVGQVGEVRLFLLTCLLMEDELEEAGREGNAAVDGDGTAPLAGDAIDRLATRIEAVAAQLKQS
ncbi:MAG: cell division protein ZapA [Rhodospirillales bacterium]